MAHAAQIAFTLFADVADEQEGQRMAEADCLQYGGDGEYRRNTGSVVGNSRPIQAGCPAGGYSAACPSGKTVSSGRSA